MPSEQAHGIILLPHDSRPRHHAKRPIADITQNFLTIFRVSQRKQWNKKNFLVWVFIGRRNVVADPGVWFGRYVFTKVNTRADNILFESFNA